MARGPCRRPRHAPARDPAKLKGRRGLPRSAPPPSQRALAGRRPIASSAQPPCSDGPQAAAQIDGLNAAGRVIADAACDCGALRGTINGDLGAEAHIQANPSRALKPSLDPRLYAEHHKAGNFLPRIIGFRHIALCFENTLAGFMGVAIRVSALHRLG